MPIQSYSSSLINLTCISRLTYRYIVTICLCSRRIYCWTYTLYNIYIYILTTSITFFISLNMIMFTYYIIGILSKETSFNEKYYTLFITGQLTYKIEFQKSSSILKYIFEIQLSYMIIVKSNIYFIRYMNIMLYNIFITHCTNFLDIDISLIIIYINNHNHNNHNHNYDHNLILN